MLLSTGGVRLMTSSSRLLLLRHSPRLLSSSESSVHDRISGLVKESPVVVFMKGVPEQPRCGFSNAVVQILRMHDVQFKAHDVLQDEDIRQGETRSFYALFVKLSMFLKHEPNFLTFFAAFGGQGGGGSRVLYYIR